MLVIIIIVNYLAAGQADKIRTDFEIFKILYRLKYLDFYVV